MRVYLEFFPSQVNCLVQINIFCNLTIRLYRLFQIYMFIYTYINIIDKYYWLMVCYNDVLYNLDDEYILGFICVTVYNDPKVPSRYR